MPLPPRNRLAELPRTGEPECLLYAEDPEREYSDMEYREEEAEGEEDERFPCIPDFAKRGEETEEEMIESSLT